MEIDDELNKLEAIEAYRNMAELHHVYYEKMLEKCDDQYDALTLTCSFIQSQVYGGE